MKKLLSLILIFALIGATAFTAFAETQIATEYFSEDLFLPSVSANVTEPVGTKLDLSATSAILMEEKSGKVLYEKSPDQKLSPASITKIMTLILIMEAIEKGNLSYEDKIAASAHAVSMGGSQIWLKENEVMTVDELLRATVIASANDAAVALAETVAGSEENFAARMNEKAAELGMTGSHFMNATGLDEDGHYSTARDIAIMSKELLRHEAIKKYTCIFMDSLRDGKSELVNTNKLVRFYKGCTGLKTGTTSVAGSCLSASAERDGLGIIAVVLKCPNSKSRFADATKLLDYGFANYKNKTVTADTSLLTPIKVINGVKDTLKIEAKGTVTVLTEKSGSGEILQTADIPKTVTAPVKKGDTVGKIHLTSGGNEIGVIPVVATEDINKPTFFTALFMILGELFQI